MEKKKPSKEACLIASYINSWLTEYVPVICNASPRTLQAYRTAITLYLVFLNTEKGVTPSTLHFKHLDHDYVEQWLKWLRDGRNCCPYTCNCRLAALRAFIRYVGTRDVACLYLSQNTALVPRQKVSKRKIDGLGKDAVSAVMREPDTRTWTGRRDMALLVLLYGTAARLDEILSMKVGQLHLDEPKPFATVMGKGSKPRTLYLLPKAVAHLKAYLKEYHPEERVERYLFYSRNHNAYGKLTQPAIDKRLKLYAKSAHEKCPDVPLNLHAHQFRHAKSSHWLGDGMNIVQISLLMGHAHIQTTMGYMDITTEQESKALATLEDENEAKLSKKWKGHENDLLTLCGLR